MMLIIYIYTYIAHGSPIARAHMGTHHGPQNQLHLNGINEPFQLCLGVLGAVFKFSFSAEGIYPKPGPAFSGVWRGIWPTG